MCHLKHIRGATVTAMSLPSFLHSRPLNSENDKWDVFYFIYFILFIYLLKNNNTGPKATNVLLAFGLLHFQYSYLLLQ